MSTKAAILQLADALVREQGFNAFSFYDIARTLGIKTSSIHYHFPSKTDLGVALVREHIRQFEQLRADLVSATPEAQLTAFLSIYERVQAENQICIVGSLATDLNTVDQRIKAELQTLVNEIIGWLEVILKRGKDEGRFFFNVPVRTRALMIVTNMLAIVQLTRLTTEEDFLRIKESIIQELTTKN